MLGSYLILGILSNSRQYYTFQVWGVCIMGLFPKINWSSHISSALQYYKFQVWRVCRRFCFPKSIEAHIYQVHYNLTHFKCDECVEGFVSLKHLKLTYIKCITILQMSSARGVGRIWTHSSLTSIQNWIAHDMIFCKLLLYGWPP